MNITFLVGNGFDLNLGLNTLYNDFIKDYLKDTKEDNELISEFKSYIHKNEDKWSSAELAFGEYTSNFSGAGAAEAFCDCHEDFCIKLANYLKREQNKIIIDARELDAVESFAEAIKSFDKAFRDEEKEVIKNATNHHSGGFVYNFVNFNYTNTLKHFVETVDGSVNLGRRTSTDINKIGNFHHVHGTVDKDMVLGVDNEAQIGNKEIFDNVGPEYKNQIIKIETNRMNRQNNDRKVEDLIKRSNLFYVYGMSLGETDRIWWERVCKHMAVYTNTHMIIHCYDAPEEGLITRKRRTYEEEVRNKIVGFSNLDVKAKASVKKRIHIQGSNLFEGIKDIAK